MEQENIANNPEIVSQVELIGNWGLDATKHLIGEWAKRRGPVCLLPWWVIATKDYAGRYVVMAGPFMAREEAERRLSLCQQQKTQPPANSAETPGAAAAKQPNLFSS